tara:strand:+ start:4990 stop:6507 length:1518 start_codon:yes stop_codon:yes gene_type:complete
MEDININIIAAVTPEGVIGYGEGKDAVCPHTGSELQNDRKWFRSMTMGCPVIVGRKTFESMGPLKGRYTVVLTQDRNMLAKTTVTANTADSNTANFVYADSIESAVKLCKDAAAREDAAKIRGPIWICGGAEIYNLAFKTLQLGLVYINYVTDNIRAKSRCVKFPLHFLDNLHYSCSNTNTRVLTYNARFQGGSLADVPANNVSTCTNIDESNYLDLMRSLLTAPIRDNRTGIPTRGLFCKTLRFKLTRKCSDYGNCSDHGTINILPMLTTKRVPFKSVVTELVWFLSGKCTDTAYLREHKNPIWDLNTTREFLDSRGLQHYEVGQTGPIYGVQWRNFGGVDQIAEAIKLLRTDPFSRRIIVSAWNPPELSKMALPPCHWSFQFYVTAATTDGNVRDDKTLSTLVNMRSADVALGVPFNIASYALLTHIIAKIVGMRSGEVVIVMGDCHIYTNHIPGIKTQLQRVPGEFPELHIENFNAVEDITSDLFSIVNYNPQPRIKFEMAI